VLSVLQPVHNLYKASDALVVLPTHKLLAGECCVMQGPLAAAWVYTQFLTRHVCCDMAIAGPLPLCTHTSGGHISQSQCQHCVQPLIQQECVPTGHTCVHMTHAQCAAQCCAWVSKTCLLPTGCQSSVCCCHAGSTRPLSSTEVYAVSDRLMIAGIQGMADWATVSAFLRTTPCL
jgi:hypothetical protein